MDKGIENQFENEVQQCEALIQSQQTLLLSTVTEQGKPESSYAPFVRDQQGAFYIYVSELAAHTKNMLQNNVVSVLFIASEKETQNLFARERIVFDCTISEIQKDDEIHDAQLQAMQEKFGETVALLRNLTDFHLLALRPVTGKYIAGFGKAFEINIEQGKLKLEHQQKL